MAQIIAARVVLTVVAISLAIGLGAGLASAQTPGATFVFHGDATAERQAELRAEWADVAAWLLSRSTDSSGDFDLTINVGSDHESIASPHLLNPGHGAPSCQWQYQRQRGARRRIAYRPNFFCLSFRSGGKAIGGFGNYVVERRAIWASGRGGWDMPCGGLTQASRYAESRGESLELDRTRRQLRAPDDWNALATLETSDAFYAQTSPPQTELGWLAVDWLVQRAGEASYIEYTTQRGAHTALGRRVRGRIWDCDPPRSTRSSPPRGRRSSASLPAPRWRRRTLRIARGSGSSTVPVSGPESGRLGRRR